MKTQKTLLALALLITLLSFGQTNVLNTTGNVLINTTTDNEVDKLQVNGTAQFTGNVTAPSFVGNLTGNAATATSTSLFNGRGLDKFIFGQFDSGMREAPTTWDSTDYSQWHSGFWDIVGANWTPDTGWYWGNTSSHRSNNSGYNFSGQQIYNLEGTESYFRTIAGGTPKPWRRIVHDGNISSFAAPVSGSINYIQNQNSSTQAASMWIDGATVSTLLLNRGMDSGAVDKMAVGFSGDGYVRWSTAADIKTYLNYIDGTGTNGYLSKFSGTGTLNNSQAYITNGIKYMTSANDADLSFGIGKEYSNGNSTFLGWRYNSGTPYGFATTYGGAVPFILQPDGGNVGIGTTAPSGKLDIFGGNSIATNLILSANYIHSYRWRFNTQDRGNAIDLDFTASDGSDAQEAVLKLSRSNSGRPEFQLYDNTIVANNGYVGIGIATPDEKLTVKGKIHAQEVRVDLQGACAPDYVFQKYYTGKSTLKSDYVMPTLAEIESFTKKNNHLPDVPSAQEVQQNGVSLGTMSNVLLQKVEELTLYAIEQNKKLMLQQGELDRLKTENENYKSLAERLSSLEKEFKK